MNEFNMSLTLIGKRLPAISDLTERETLFAAYRASRPQPRTIIEKRDTTIVNWDWESLSETLGYLELPEGWGNILVYLTNPLILGIQSGMMPPEILDISIQSSPLMLLIRVLLINAISEQKEASRLIDETAQELFDIFKLMLKLRNGGPRLLPRMLNCIHKLMTWTT